MLNRGEWKREGKSFSFIFSRIGGTRKQYFNQEKDFCKSVGRAQSSCSLLFSICRVANCIKSEEGCGETLYPTTIINDSMGRRGKSEFDFEIAFFRSGSVCHGDGLTWRRFARLRCHIRPNTRGSFALHRDEHSPSFFKSIKANNTFNKWLVSPTSFSIFLVIGNL